MANLFLDKAGADGVVAAVKGEIEELKETAKRIDNSILKDLPTYWQGEAHDKTEMTYLDSYQKFLSVQIPDMVDQLKQYMEQCVQAITDVDHQLAGK